MNENEKFDALESMYERYSLSDLLAVAGNDALMHRIITMAYRAGQRYAVNAVVGKIDEAVTLNGFEVATVEVDGIYRMDLRDK